jgi:hypothetical protein
MTSRNLVVCGILGLALGLELAWQSPAQAGEGRALFNGQDLTGWKRYVDPGAKDADPDKIWKVQDGTIVCEGNVNGYLITEEDFENYELLFQWRWGSSVTRGRNSGAFVHVVGLDKIWPKGVEAQLAADHAGDIWLVDGAQLTIDPARQDKKTPRHYFRTKDNVEKPLGEWNDYRIVCDGDTITLYVNGQQVNQGTKSELKRGKILFQSEGAEVHFRDIRVKPL